jgi:TRAP-type C4-dicarboxylate transport system permease small subunit
VDKAPAGQEPLADGGQEAVDQGSLPPEGGPPTTLDAPTALDRYAGYLTRALLYIAGAALVGMLVLIVSDVIGIKIFAKPVRGGIEFVTFFAVVTIAFAVPHTYLVRGHVSVDFIVDLFPRRLKLVVDALMVALGVVLLALLARYGFKYAGDLRASGEVSMTQKIPFYPFVYGMAVAFVITLLLLLLDLAKAVRKAVKTWTR